MINKCHNLWPTAAISVFELFHVIAVFGFVKPCVCVFDWLMIAYIALFSALLSRLTALACGSTWVTSFIAHCFLNIHRSGVLTALAWLVPHETAAVSAQVLCTSYNHAPCHFMTVRATLSQHKTTIKVKSVYFAERAHVFHAPLPRCNITRETDFTLKGAS